MSPMAVMSRDTALKLSQDELCTQLKTSIDGLSQEEATRRLTEQGANVVGKKTANALVVFGRQLKSSLVYLLVIASLIAYAIGDYTDGTVILVILVINTSLGFYQEYKSEKILEKLSQLITRQVRVKRGGVVTLVDESMIVPGDVLVVREGDIVPADVRLVEVDYLQANESQVTGESVPVEKSAAPAAGAADALLYTGSSIEKGVGTGIVYATGAHTELGNIVSLSTTTKKETQYEKSLKLLSTMLIRVTLIALAVVFIAKLLVSDGRYDIPSLLLFVIALAVAVVPEVLPVISTVTLSIGAMKLAKRHVVVRRLSAIEDLGNVNLLCTDKTGTLTENKMVIHAITSDDTDLFQKLAYATIARLTGRKRRTQNSYDAAFLAYVPEHIRHEAKELAIVKEIPFDPDARRNRIILADAKSGVHYLVSMGAPEMIMSICTTGKKRDYVHILSEEGKSGLHHLALTYKEVPYTDGFDIVAHEHSMHFSGFASFEDPLRPGVKATIEHAEKLGIKIKVLTGDSREVAEYTGIQIGLVKEGEHVLTGDELEAMTPAEFAKAVLGAHMFARVSPEQKFNIISALKKEYVVAYQGDGINDAPALRLADVAIAVNTATDIAKENADVVLLNKSLEVIVNGVRYGRETFVNINKYIAWTMVSNFGNFIALGALYLFSTELPLLPVQILLTSLISDIPLITVATDTVDDADVVQPEKHNMKEIVLLSLVLGVPTALFELMYFLFVKSQSAQVAQTSFFVFITLLAFIVFYTLRNRGHFWKTGAPSHLLNVSFLLATMFTIGIVYLPQSRAWLSFTPLTLASLATIVALVVVYFLLVDQVKVLYYRREI